MFDTTKQFTRDILTEDNDGKVFCFARAAIIFGGISIVAFAAGTFFADPKEFNLVDYGRTLLEYLSGSAALIFAKGKSGE